MTSSKQVHFDCDSNSKSILYFILCWYYCLNREVIANNRNPLRKSHFASKHNTNLINKIESKLLCLSFSKDHADEWNGQLSGCLNYYMGKTEEHFGYYGAWSWCRCVACSPYPQMNHLNKLQYIYHLIKEKNSAPSIRIAIIVFDIAFCAPKHMSTMYTTLYYYCSLFNQMVNGQQ